MALSGCHPAADVIGSKCGYKISKKDILSIESCHSINVPHMSLVG